MSGQASDQFKSDIIWAVILATCIALGIIALNACNGPYYRQPVVVQSVPTQQVQQQVVANGQDFQIVQDPNTGLEYSVFYDAGVQYMIDLATWNTWYGMGGYGYVINHYHGYGGCVSYVPSRYRSYRVENHYSYNSYRPSFRPSSSRAYTPSGGSPAFRTGSPAPTYNPRPSFRTTTTAPSRPSFQSSSSSSRPSFRTSSSSSSRPSFRH